MNEIGSGFRQMCQAEVDADMDNLFLKQALEDAEERGKANAGPPVHTQAPNHDPVIRSAEMEWARARLLSIMSHPRSPVLPVKASDRRGVGSAKPVVAPLEGCKPKTVVPFPSKPVSMPAPPEKIVVRGVGKVGVALEFASFPVGHVLDVKEYDDPMREMTELCKQLHKHKDYGLVREEYCHLSIRLNLIGKVAPAYRPELNSRAAWGSAFHNMINRDQVVIDLQWCHATSMALSPQEPMHRALFCDNAEFSFDDAWALACKVWRNVYRATEALCLTTFQQCQLLKLHGAELEDRLEGLGSGWRASGGRTTSRLAAVKRLISQWAERDKRILPRRAFYETLWVARVALGCDATHQQIALLHALMVGGDVQDRTTIRDSLKSLDKYVPVA